MLITDIIIVLCMSVIGSIIIATTATIINYKHKEAKNNERENRSKNSLRA